MAAPNRKHLKVEGETDKYAIIQMMAAHVSWGNTPDTRPVKVEAVGSVDDLLARYYLSSLLKSREVEILRIVIDADEQFVSRWSTIRRECLEAFPDLPGGLPTEGLVQVNSKGQRLGVWIMPDNQSRGMLETFLQFLVPARAGNEKQIWDKARMAVADAVACGAKCKQAHLDKANIHTWLAWQDPPGEALGNALVKAILNPTAPYAQAFAGWFRRLYEL